MLLDPPLIIALLIPSLCYDSREAEIFHISIGMRLIYQNLRHDQEEVGIFTYLTLNQL